MPFRRISQYRSRNGQFFGEGALVAPAVPAGMKAGMLELGPKLGASCRINKKLHRFQHLTLGAGGGSATANKILYS